MLQRFRLQKKDFKMKNQPSTLITILLIFACLLGVQSRSLAIGHSITMTDTIIPAGFNPEKHVLLFLEMPKKNSTKKSEGITKKLDKAVKKNWPYKYEIVSQDEISGANSKYTDTSIYRYAILNSLSSYRGMRESHDPRPSQRGVYTQSTASVTSIDFCFYDRVTQEKYEYSGKHSSFIGMTISAFMKMIKKDKNIPDK